jgi:filamentous hemagglutinin family protein
MFCNPAVMADIVLTGQESGSGITVTPGTNTTDMTAANGGIGYFSDFDIDLGHTVTCVQGGVNNSALFKVDSLDGTQIYGTFNSDGKIYLQDIRGILVGATGIINTSEFVASTLNINKDDWQQFINGEINQLKFEMGAEDPISVMENKGIINAARVYLIGSQVLNSGTIKAGENASDLLVMAAGDKVFLTHENSKVLIKVPSDLGTPDPALNKVDIYAASTINANQVVLAAGDVFTAALNVGSLAATANRDITLEDTITTTGDITLVAGDDVDAQVLDAGGSIDISASDNTINLHQDLTADVDILLNNNTVVDAGKTLEAGQDVILADDKTMTGNGALTVEADRDIYLGGVVTAAGTLELKADADTIDRELGATPGGKMWARSTLETSSGNIDIYANNIELDDDVTAAADFILNNDTYVAPGKTLKAGNNVNSKAHLTAEGNLNIEATGGSIIAHEIIMPAAPAESTTLTLKQNDKLDMEQNVTVLNRNNTHLVAQSTADSVTSAAAAKWLDITATAYEDLVLSDISGNITTKELTTTTRDIKITAENGKLYAEGAISAGRDVIITATDESSDSIFLSDGAHNVDAGRDIWLNNNTYADGPTTLTAGQDIRLGYNENLDTYESKTLTAEESLTLEADRHITLGGDVKVIGSEPDTLIVKADADTVNKESGAVPGGDVHAMGKLTTIGGYENDILVYGDNIRVDGIVSSAADIEVKAIDDVILNNDVLAAGDIDIYSSEDTTYLSGDLVKATGDVTLHNNTVLNGGEQRIDAETGTMTAMKDVDKSTGGNITLAGGSGITLGGNVTGSGMANSDTMTFEDDVTADGSAQRFDAGLGTLDADGSITKITAGNLNLGGDAGIELSDDVSGTGMTASDAITFEDDVTANGSGSQRLDAGLGKLVTQNGVDIDKITSGSLTLAGGNQIYLGGNVSTNTTDGAFSMNHLIFEDPVIANGTGDYKDQTFTAAPLGAQAGSSLIADSTITKEDGGDSYIDHDGGNLTLKGGWQVDISGQVVVEDGALTIEADQDIYLGDNVISFGDMVIKADADGDALDLHNNYYPQYEDIIGGDVFAYGTLVSMDGSIAISGFDEPLTVDNFDHAAINLYEDVFAAYDVTLHNNTKLRGEGYQEIAAGCIEDGTLTAEGWVWKTTPGSLYLEGYNSDSEHNNGKAIDLQYEGCLPAASTFLGNLELYAEDGDIQISGDLTTFGFGEEGPDICEGYYRDTGGVLVVAENGKIYTDGASPENDTLNIGIVGNSDDVSHRMYDYGSDYADGPLGVEIPGYEAKLAIAVLSSEDLKFGPDTMLIAKGRYDSSIVDDRDSSPDVSILREDGVFIGNVERDEGDAIDAAVVLGSGGDVHLDGRAIDVETGGTMIVSAHDTVSFGDFETFNFDNFEGCEDLACFLIKLALRFHEDIDFEDLCAAYQAYREQYYESEKSQKDLLEDFLNNYFEEGFFFNIDRLEVVSRITEWLSQVSAFGTLPYPYNPEIVEELIGGDYVLRGAGLGNPAIVDGRAWVLEDLLEPAPLYREAGEKAEVQEFREGGCTALMNWLATEIGVPEDDIQVVVANALALNTDVQPCEMCARLMEASKTLEDAEGTQVAALARVVNEFVTTPAPPSPEQMTQIAAALAEHAGDGTYYAAAGKWIDALVAYVGIMNTEMGYSASDAAAFAQKYLALVEETGNAALTAYVQARISALGG